MRTLRVFGQLVLFVLPTLIIFGLDLAGAKGLIVFCWTPILVGAMLWWWVEDRQATRLPSDRELDRELQDLLESESNK